MTSRTPGGRSIVINSNFHQLWLAPSLLHTACSTARGEKCKFGEKGVPYLVFSPHQSPDWVVQMWGLVLVIFICSEPRHLTLTVALSTQSNEWVVHGKLLAEGNLTEMLWGSLALADIPFRGTSNVGRHVSSETTGCWFCELYCISYNQCILSPFFCSFTRPKRILGLCYVVVKVSILINFEILWWTMSYSRLC